jgi:dipeptidase D
MKRIPAVSLDLTLILCLLPALLSGCTTSKPEVQPTMATGQTQAAAVPSVTVPTPAASLAAPSGERIPLKDALKDLQPADVWQNFYHLTRAPRPSHHEQKVGEFLMQFGKGLGLETVMDEVGNVIIRRPAAQGMEKRKGVVLQAHLDMVPQKNSDTVFNFEQDPIQAFIQDGWVVADGTTLGADDGSGVAIAMAVLQSKENFGPIEALFTVDEEDGFSGANNLKAGVLKGAILINLDSEEMGIFTISSAGGENGIVDAPYPQIAAPAGMAALKLSVSGLKGGHSGVDIALGRGHAVRLLIRLLAGAATQVELHVAEMGGGSASNAIPREASAWVVAPQGQVETLKQYVEKLAAVVRSELSVTDPGVSIAASPAELPAQVMEADIQRRIINALYATPQGVMRMNDSVAGLVETSTNLGILQASQGRLQVNHYLRSSVDSELDDLNQMMAGVWNLAGIPISFSGRYPGWKPDPKSMILDLMQKVYRDQYGSPATVIAIHAGLECGVIRAVYPNMDVISIGPTIQNVHSPDERMEVASIKQVTDLLFETLRQIP